MDGVSIYLDDVLVAGCTLDEHRNRLAEVLQRLENSGMRLNKQKCFLLRPSIGHLGQVVDEEGIRPTEEKVKAIKEAPAPPNVTQLRSFLGLINYYNKFLPNLAANLTPLYSLLNKHQRWVWNDEQRVAFQRAKDALQSDALTHYDPGKALVLAYDASDYGVGAVLSHVVDGGKERPIAYMQHVSDTRGCPFQVV